MTADEIEEPIERTQWIAFGLSLMFAMILMFLFIILVIPKIYD